MEFRKYYTNFTSKCAKKLNFEVEIINADAILKHLSESRRCGVNERCISKCNRYYSDGAKWVHDKIYYRTRIFYSCYQRLSLKRACSTEQGSFWLLSLSPLLFDFNYFLCYYLIIPGTQAAKVNPTVKVTNVNYCFGFSDFSVDEYLTVQVHYG